MDWKTLLVVGGILAAFIILKRVSFLSAEKARELLRQGAIVVDVRNPGEFNSGPLPQARNIPLGELSSELPRRIPDRRQVLLLHCLSGGRSGIAQRQLRKLGYSNAYNLGSFARAKALANR